MDWVTYALGFLFLLLLMAAIHGWGVLTRNAVGALTRHGPAPTAGIGELMTLGLATMIGVAGVLNLLYLYSPLGRVSLMIPAVMSPPRFVRWLSSHRRAVMTEMNWGALSLAVGGAALVITWILIPPALNGSDDTPGYLVFPHQLLAIGGLLPEPFSERRMFSLGGHFGLQALVLGSLPLQFQCLVEPVLGIVLAHLALLGLCRRLHQPTELALALGLAISALNGLGSRYLANTAPAFLCVPLLMFLFSRTIQPSSDDSGALEAGLVAGALVSLRTTMLPPALVGLGCLLLTPALNRGCITSIRRAGWMLVGAAIVAFPLMLVMHRSSGTLLYPFLGRGYHSTALDLIPTPNAGISLKSFLAALWTTIQADFIAIAAVLISAIEMAHSWKRKSGSLRRVFLGIGVGASYAAIVFGTAGISAARYAFPFVLAFLVVSLAVGQTGRAVVDRWRSIGIFWRGAILAGMILAATAAFLRSRDSFLDWALQKLANRQYWAQPSKTYSDDLRKLQEATPTGSPILAYVERAYLMDQRRNRIFVNDQPGLVGPAPGWRPGMSGVETARYLRGQGVEYIAVMPFESVGDSPVIPSQGSWSTTLMLGRKRFLDALRQPPFIDSVVLCNQAGTLYKVPSE